MKRATLLATATLALTVILASGARAQDPDPPSKIEVGMQFSSLTFPEQTFPGSVTFGRGNSEAGFGGRFTFNFNKHIAIEAEGNFFPHENFNDFTRSGRLLQGQFGLKAGKRFGKFGVFAKARPGFVSFSKALAQVGTTTIFDPNGQPITFPVFGNKRRTHFSMDLGGVLEFYPSRKVLTRIDIGDTIIHYGSDSFFSFTLAPPTSRATHNLQISAGIGFRFGSLQPEGTAPQVHGEKQKRFEVGAQFSSLGLRQIERFSFGFPLTISEFRDTITQVGFGGRLTYNLTASFALEIQGDFYPKTLPIVNNGRAGGRILQEQAGVKAGKRWDKFGVFAKARPGIVSFSRSVEFSGLDPTFGFPIFRVARKNYFSFDLGGVLEFYPSRRIITRFDGGDTMIHYRSIDNPIVFFPAVSTFHTAAETTHNFQFSAGVGFRF
ncbi:MAG: outer membrane beta-barrel protein [bacterium]